MSEAEIPVSHFLRQLGKSILIALALVSAATTGAIFSIGTNFVPIIDGLSLFPILSFYVALLTVLFQLFSSQDALTKVHVALNYEVAQDLLIRRAFARLPPARSISSRRDIVKFYRTEMSVKSLRARQINFIFGLITFLMFFILLLVFRDRVLLWVNLSGGLFLFVSAAICLVCGFVLRAMPYFLRRWKRRRRTVMTSTLVLALMTCSALAASASGGWVYIDYLRQDGPVVLITHNDNTTRPAAIIARAQDGFVVFYARHVTPTYVPTSQIKSISGGIYRKPRDIGAT